MIELFAELIAKRLKLDFSELMKSSLKKDRYLRENADLSKVFQEDAEGSQRFLKIDDKYAYIKKDVYFSYFIHKILIGMKRKSNEDSDAHTVLICESEADMQSILDEHIYRIISQVQDAEYSITNKRPVSFMNKPVLKSENRIGYRLLGINIPRYGRISMIAFYPSLRNTDVSQMDVIRDLLNNLNEYEKITYFYRLDSAFTKDKRVSRVEFVESGKRIFQECMPETCIHYSIFRKDSLTSDTYASRHAELLSLQLKEDNIPIMHDLIKEMNEKKDIRILEDLEDSYILDPISSVCESLKLCKVSNFREFIDSLDSRTSNLSMESISIGGIRSLNRFTALDIQDNFVRSIDEQMQDVTMSAIISGSAPSYRYDPDGEMRSRNNRVYSIDIMQEAIRRAGEAESRRLDEMIIRNGFRDQFFQAWLDEQE